ncbi:putative protein-serine/threonine phosphatase [Lupinus albus]|uniref:Serine-threonine protein phosphatase N-terminal domain-containing protein n=1 Tax=Lupinus albus TaxID=3870 RepID=A0A6A4QW17_LUPAL|nr:putative protein-serine/threonine phosphatase [Lupinus albus]
MEHGVLDAIINRMLVVRGRPGKQVQLSGTEIKQLCMVSRDIFLKQPNLLELEAPIKICRIYMPIPCSLYFITY